MSAHTPGPWIVVFDPPNPLVHATVAWCAEYQIATVGDSYESHGDRLADASLIAESPVMHDLLTEAIHLVRRISADPMEPETAEWLRRVRESLERVGG